MPAPTAKIHEEAFDLLRSTVDDLHSTGRRIYAAGLKPELKRRSYGGFDEKAHRRRVQRASSAFLRPHSHAGLSI